MKLYDYNGAPNPRRVKIFAAEKKIELELIQCDLVKGEHKLPEFIVKSPSGKIPVLELADGRCISESVAIWRYLEEIYLNQIYLVPPLMNWPILRAGTVILSLNFGHKLEFHG